VANADHAIGDPQSVANALGHTTYLDRFDGNGRPLTIRDANNVVLTTTWHPRGWLLSSSINSLNTGYERDAVGQLTSLTRPDGSKALYGYDAARRLVSVGDLGGRTMTHTLDNLGNITQTVWTNADNSVARRSVSSFDTLGREQRSTQTRNAVNFVTQYGYDANGNRRLVTDPKTQSTNAQFDALDRPRQVTDALSGLLRLSYDARGQLTELRAPNNASTTFSVDGLGNVTQEVSPNSGAGHATYDGAGNVVTLTDARGIVRTQSRDALNRLTAVSYPSGGENVAYTWDSGAGCTFGIGRLCAVSDNGGSTGFACDARGNLVRQTRTEAGFTYTPLYSHDDADRLAAVTAPLNQALTIGRDADGLVEEIITEAEGNPQLKLVEQVRTRPRTPTSSSATTPTATCSRARCPGAPPATATTRWTA